MTKDYKKERIDEIRRTATQPLEAFNTLNDIGKAYAYGSDCQFLLSYIADLETNKSNKRAFFHVGMYFVMLIATLMISNLIFTC